MANATLTAYVLNYAHTFLLALKHISYIYIHVYTCVRASYNQYLTTHKLILTTEIYVQIKLIANVSMESFTCG